MINIILGDTFNRPIHILEAPALDKSAIGDSLDVNKITEDYFEHEYGLTYIDDFCQCRFGSFCSEARFGLIFFIKVDMWEPIYQRAYWFCKLQKISGRNFQKIFKNHHLTQCWAYKYDSRASEKNNSYQGINVHADFAAINVNAPLTRQTWILRQVG